MTQQARLLILPLRNPTPNPRALRPRRVQPVSNRTSWESGWSLAQAFAPPLSFVPLARLGPVVSECEPWTLQGAHLVANYSVLTMGLVLWLRV